MKIRWERWNKKKKARKFLVLEEIALTVRQIIVKSIFAPFFRTGVTNQRKTKRTIKSHPQDTSTQAHTSKQDHVTRKRKKSWTQNYLLKEIDKKKMFRPSATTTRLLAGNSRSKNHDTNTNEM